MEPVSYFTTETQVIGLGIMERKNIKKMIQNGEMAVGMCCQLLDPAVAEIAGLAGFDFIRIEGEHMNFDWNTVRNFVVAADGVGIPVIARVNRLDDITGLNDLGIAGYQIPHVRSAEQARDIVSRVKYAPTGVRGYARYVRGQKYGMTSFEDYKKFAEEEMLLIVQIEDQMGIDHMEEIISTEGIDVICSGKGDLSQALGMIGDLNHDAIREVENRIIMYAEKYGKKTMILGRDEKDWLDLVSHGNCVITEHAVDLKILMDGALEARKGMQYLKDHYQMKQGT